MHAEFVPVSKLFKRSIPCRDMLREPNCPTILICAPPVRAVASPARVSCFVCSTAHVVQASHLVPRVAARYCHPDCAPELSKHNGVGAPFSFVVGQRGNGEAHCARRRLSCKDFEDLLKVLVDFPKSSRTEGYHLPSVEPSLGHLKRAHNVICSIADNI